ncbi:MAG: histidine--tRNA ligase, partial [Bacteroidota bacterium]
MSKVQVSIPQGTRDFDASVVRKRRYIMQTIQQVFEQYGFEPLETPAMENLDTLMGKYGEEGDKLIFKILNNGLDHPSKTEVSRIEFEKVLAGKNTNAITERALRYDLTIPFARYIAMHHQQLTMPYKRYQIQPVWRADRPQKGRYREFYQCDADIVGSKSLLNEVELASVYSDVFNKLKVDVNIKINSRKILAALAQSCGNEDKLTDITVAIDKLDKIGIDKVKEELTQRDISKEAIDIIVKYLQINGTNQEKIESLITLLKDSKNKEEGIQEITTLLSYFPKESDLVIDLTLARGLNYYTGIIFEVQAKHVQIGSIGGGGRYDDLTGLFGVPNIPGVGISFGLDRIYDVMEASQLFPNEVHAGTDVLFFNLGEAESRKALELMQQLRQKNISCELFHENLKMDKQFKYAEKKNITYVAIIGAKELADGTCNIKHLSSGKQETVK